MKVLYVCDCLLIIVSSFLSVAVVCVVSILKQDVCRYVRWKARWKFSRVFGSGGKSQKYSDTTAVETLRRVEFICFSTSVSSGASASFVSCVGASVFLRRCSMEKIPHSRTWSSQQTVLRKCCTPINRSLSDILNWKNAWRKDAVIPTYNWNRNE